VTLVLDRMGGSAMRVTSIATVPCWARTKGVAIPVADRQHTIQAWQPCDEASRIRAPP